MTEEYAIAPIDNPEQSAWGIIGRGLDAYNQQQAGPENSKSPVWRGWWQRPLRGIIRLAQHAQATMNPLPPNTPGALLVAILNEPRDYHLARDEHWYRIPVESVAAHLRDHWPPRQIAFYQTQIFAEERYSVRYYADVLDIARAGGGIDVETDGDTYHANPP